ncbi:MAG: DUF4258 domain-containing protein [Myxococcales bacterium]|nr:MAG: DUF4258 domain-containing protein [Myxococcales bacterium]
MHASINKEEARAAIRRIIQTGTVTFTGHARKEMSNDHLGEIDVLNVLRGGWVEGPEWENGGWRYKVCTQKITVVVEFECEDDMSIEQELDEVVIITAWRL